MLFTYRKNDDTQKADGDDNSKGPEVTGEVVIGKLLNLHQDGPVNTHTHTHMASVIFITTWPLTCLQHWKVAYMFSDWSGVFLYSAIICFQTLLCSSRMWFWMTVALQSTSNIHWSGVLTVTAQFWVVTWLVQCEIVAILARVLRTSYNHAGLQPGSHFLQSHIHRVHVCLTVICHLHFWQNGWGHLHATAVTWGWNGQWNKESANKKLTMEKRILLLLLPGLEPMTFQSGICFIQI